MWRISACFVVVVGCSSCDLLEGSFECGYQAGYATADFFLDGVEEARASRAAWADACAAHGPITEAQQEEGDDRCFDEGNSSLAELVACDDPGPGNDALPSGCTSTTCPTGVEGRCLCCDERPTDCGLAGDFCVDNAECCSGSCVIETVDGGPGSSGTCG